MIQMDINRKKPHVREEVNYIKETFRPKEIRKLIAILLKECVQDSRR